MYYKKLYTLHYKKSTFYLNITNKLKIKYLIEKIKFAVIIFKYR